MRYMEDLKDRLCDELKEMSNKEKFTASDLDVIDTLTHSIKSIETVMTMDEYSYDDYSNRGGSYGRGRYSNGMYSRNDMGYSRRNIYENSYDMSDELQNMMDHAETEQDREAIRQCMNKIRR